MLLQFISYHYQDNLLYVTAYVIKRLWSYTKLQKSAHVLSGFQGSVWTPNTIISIPKLFLCQDSTKPKQSMLCHGCHCHQGCCTGLLWCSIKSTVMPICLSGHHCHFMSKQAVRYISVKYTCVTVIHHFTMCITVVIIVFMIIIMLPQQNIVKAYYCILIIILVHHYCTLTHISVMFCNQHMIWHPITITANCTSLLTHVYVTLSSDIIKIVVIKSLCITYLHLW